MFSNKESLTRCCDVSVDVEVVEVEVVNRTFKVPLTPQPFVYHCSRLTEQRTNGSFLTHVLLISSATVELEKFVLLRVCQRFLSFL